MSGRLVLRLPRLWANAQNAADRNVDPAKRASTHEPLRASGLRLQSSLRDGIVASWARNNRPPARSAAGSLWLGIENPAAPGQVSSWSLQKRGGRPRKYPHRDF